VVDKKVKPLIETRRKSLFVANAFITTFEG